MAILTIHSKNGTEKILFDPPKRLSDLLEEAGAAPDYPCGRRGRCGKCSVKIRGQLSHPAPEERLPGWRLACKTQVLGDAEVFLPERVQTRVTGAGNEGEILPEKAGRITGTGPLTAVADIGTTTVAVDYYDAVSGKKLGTSGGDNPQQGVAADIISRLEAALQGRGELLREQIVSCLTGMARDAGALPGIREWIITGNTAMLTLLTGEDPGPLTHSPFRARRLFGETVELAGIPAYLPPCVHAFFGADALCSLMASGMAEKEGISLLCDIGTNGELVLWKNGQGYAASVAMGPALEGAGIRQGCRYMPGAIHRVTVMGGRILASTVDRCPPVGICGSGLLDAVACGLELGIIREDGTMEAPMELAGEVRLYPEDIRAVQLAKAALRAGIETLMQETHSAPEEVKELLICGGFGKGLNPISAGRIGMIPGGLLRVCRSTGNAALSGAGLLRSEAAREKAAKLCGKIRYISLAEQAYFRKAYIRFLNMSG